MTPCDTDDANYFGAKPVIDVEKEVSVDGGMPWPTLDGGPGPELLEGGTPLFRFTVKNTGNVDLSNVMLDDSMFDLNGAEAGRAHIVGNLAAGESHVFEYTGAWQAGQHTNVATASGCFKDDAGK